MITYKIYNKKNNIAWEDFINKSINGTIFQSQTFLTYHINKTFRNHSLMFYKKNNLIGVFSASENGADELFSHPGASFGGIVTQEISLSNLLEIIDLIESYAKENNFCSITMIPTPSVYHNNLDESLLYALLWKNYTIKEQYYSSVIPLENNVEKHLALINRNKSRSKDYYSNIIELNRLTVEWNNDFNKFYPILEKNKKMYNSKPTHSLEEIYRLNDIMPDKIKLMLIKKNNKVIGGNMIFIANESVAIIFYNMIDYDYVNLQISVIQVIESIKWAYKNNFKFLDFGVSHESEQVNPLAPKISLIKFKEEFGAFGSIRTVLNKNILDAK